MKISDLFFTTTKIRLKFAEVFPSIALSHFLPISPETKFSTQENQRLSP
jgi:hypothetical protein